ncbi:hypothetical protein [Nostoc piscinale]|uniref:hypothetical protein n=1 Tax=Nostoc piscinale TaxID=224012 RepID=UPI000AC59C2D|nr:hypothetical protein [Nostoc piscinale]
MSNKNAKNAELSEFERVLASVLMVLIQEGSPDETDFTALNKSLGIAQRAFATWTMPSASWVCRFG